MALFKIIFSAGILVVGVVGVHVFIVSPWLRRQRLGEAIESSRPWRPLGAAICCVVAVMFVLGIYVVDIPDNPRVYATYWAVMLLLQLWLCILALKDVRYTREQLAMQAAMDK